MFAERCKGFSATSLRKGRLYGPYIQSISIHGTDGLHFLRVWTLRFEFVQGRVSDVLSQAPACSRRRDTFNSTVVR